MADGPLHRCASNSDTRCSDLEFFGAPTLDLQVNGGRITWKASWPVQPSSLSSFPVTTKRMYFLKRLTGYRDYSTIWKTVGLFLPVAMPALWTMEVTTRPGASSSNKPNITRK